MSKLCTKTEGGGMEGGGGRGLDGKLVSIGPAGLFSSGRSHRFDEYICEAEISDCMYKCTVNLTRKETKL